MLSSPITHEDKAVIAALKNRIIQAAFNHEKNTFDARTAFLLQKNKLLKDVHRIFAREDTHDIVNNPEHPDRLPCDWGPFIFARDGDSQLAVIEVADLLIDNDASLRNAALRHLDLGMHRLTSRTIEAIGTRRKRISSVDEWLDESVSINDTLRDDFFYNLAGVRQCLQQPYDEGLEQFIKSILHPSLEMLNALRPPIWNPFEQQDKIHREISTCVQKAQTLRDVLEQYYVRLGYLPFAASFSMPEVVRQWLDCHPSQEHVWNELWDWADASLDPLKGYFAAFIFLSRPDLIEMPEVQRLWSVVADIAVQGNETQANSDKYRPWKLRCDLARHYCQYLECLLPGQDGEKIATSSWWLAHQVLVMIPSTEDVKCLCEHSIHQHKKESHHVHALCHPQIKGSALRCATLFLPSVWSLSLLCQIGRNATSFGQDSISSVIRAQITRELEGHLVSGFPRVTTGRNITYAFEDSIANSAIEWAKNFCDQTDVDKIKALVSLHTQEVEIQELLKMMDEFEKHSPVMQTFVIRLLSLAAYADHVSADELWARLQRPEWRRSTIQAISTEILPDFCDCIIEVMAKADSERSVYLSHIFGSEYHSCSTDEERQNYLLLFVMISCIATGTVSGLERILEEIPRDALSRICGHWLETLASLAEIAPPWAAGRIRPLLVALHKNG